ncbi:MAG TPA: rhodanese-like domain-containing protein [Bryobacteraceae bacterium]
MNTPVPMEISPRQLKEKLDAGETVHLVDVREPQEYAVARIEGGELIPMRTIPQVLESLREKSAAGPLVFYCHHGMRSLQTVSWLRRQGFPECVSLQGGIDLWSVVIDSSVPRY